MSRLNKYYSILGLPPNASKDDVKKKYRKHTRCDLSAGLSFTEYRSHMSYLTAPWLQPHKWLARRRSIANAQSVEGLEHGQPLLQLLHVNVGAWRHLRLPDVLRRRPGRRLPAGRARRDLVLVAQRVEPGHRILHHRVGRLRGGRLLRRPG